MMTVITARAARDKHQECLAHVSELGALVLMSGWTGGDFSKLDPDEIVRDQPGHAQTSALEAFTTADPGRARTVREIARHAAIGGRGPVTVGDPEMVADTLQDWVARTDVNGFNLAYAVMPETFVDFVELVVPVLQRRGAFKTEYAPGTLRDKLYGRARLRADHPAAAYRRGWRRTKRVAECANEYFTTRRHYAEWPISGKILQMRRASLKMLLLMCFSPFLVVSLIVFTTQISTQYREYNNLARSRSLVSAVANMADLAGTRGPAEGMLSIKYSASGDADVQVELNAARAGLNASLARMSADAPGIGLNDPQARSDLAFILERFGSVATLRRSVDERKAQAADVVGFLQPTAPRAFDLIKRIGFLSTSTEIARIIDGVYALLQFIDGTHMEGGGVYQAYGSGSLQGRDADTYVLGGGTQELFKAHVMAAAPAAIAEQFAAYLKGPVESTIHDGRAFVQSVIDGKPLRDPAAKSVVFAAVQQREAILQGLLGQYEQAMSAAIDQRMADVWNLVVAYAGTIMLAMVLAGCVTYVILRYLAGILMNMASTMTALAQGDVSVSIHEADRSHEIGAMARSILVFKDNMIRSAQLAAAQNLERQTKEERASRIQAAVHGFEQNVARLIKSVGGAVSSMHATSDGMTRAADRTLEQATDAATSARNTSSNVEAVAVATDHLAGSVREIAEKVTNSRNIATRALADSETTNETVLSLSESAQRIGEVVQIISSIAAQTNLLALNATIEASRAGDAGKGFAVVASEVKSLATQTARATDEIKSQISEVQGLTAKAVSAIKHIGATIGVMSDISMAIATAVEAQTTATAEIAGTVADAARGSAVVSTNVTNIREVSLTTKAATTHIADAARDLDTQAERLNSAISDFIIEVKAA